MKKSWIKSALFSWMYTTIALGLLFISVTNASSSVLAPLPQTGQTTCYSMTGLVMTSCSGTGQDGDKKTGISWPSPRFIQNSNNSITDILTGLVWVQNANLMTSRDALFDTDGTVNDGSVTWQHALDYVKKLNDENYLGYKNWRLPNMNELHSLFSKQEANPPMWAQSQGFTNVQYSYWSSTTNESSPTEAWGIGANASYQKSGYNYVLAVRTEHEVLLPVTPSSLLPKTGQTDCWSENGTMMATCLSSGRERRSILVRSVGLAPRNPSVSYTHLTLPTKRIV